MCVYSHLILGTVVLQYILFIGQFSNNTYAVFILLRSYYFLVSTSGAERGRVPFQWSMAHTHTRSNKCIEFSPIKFNHLFSFYIQRYSGIYVCQYTPPLSNYPRYSQYIYQRAMRSRQQRWAGGWWWVSSGYFAEFCCSRVCMCVCIATIWLSSANLTFDRFMVLKRINFCNF